ncbi:alcohol dehydrogenase [Pseudoroseomonas wenyumeiae]|uniref:alcohol dehydrogenase n=1 Tax=Teichococcus wenyumeiae TaxID=2478470 RepID=A0A3A9K143_9PROT|nr:alcohol dehydrogenase [Pseudoroseomonas wenyumeiae]RKK05069.1 alcohol dehydrogenase [Pseudoroseomonas wenyumeiae]RMI25067.1 alcohol dehydrogenase [Pseudoroseomonas wenyumeiae]
MRAWSLVEYGAPLQEMEMPTPEPKGTEVLVQVSHCGVCHSDLHTWEGYYQLGGGRRLEHAARGRKLPLAQGHEIVGRVVASGPDAGPVPVGERRIVYPWIGCGQCDRCKAEEDNLCPKTWPIGILQDGGFATHVLVPHPRYLVDPGNLNPGLAATYACSGITVYSAIKKLMPLPPDVPVVVVGMGGLGLSAIAMLKAMGHRAIIGVDVAEEKLEAARQVGATATVQSTGENVTARLVEAAGGPLRAALDLVNASATARFLVDALGKGGTLVQVGLFGGEITLDLPLMAMREQALRGSFVGSLRDLREVVALANQGGLLPIPTEEMPQSQAYEALQRLKNGQAVGRLVLRAEAV